MCECMRLPNFCWEKTLRVCLQSMFEMKVNVSRVLHVFFGRQTRSLLKFAYKEFRLSFLQSAGDPHATIYLLDISLESLNCPHGFVIEDPRFLRLLPACAKTSMHDINQLYINRCIVPIQYSLTLLQQADWLLYFQASLGAFGQPVLCQSSSDFNITSVD